jgi:hypothetical protein
MGATTTSAALVRRASLAAAGAVACAACGSGGACARPSHGTGQEVAGAECPDLTFQHRSYVEWRVVHPHGSLQEVGDASYPPCTRAGACGGDPLDGLGATDLWQYDHVDATRAVIGLRQDTHTYVVFVRTGLDPTTLAR